MGCTYRHRLIFELNWGFLMRIKLPIFGLAKGGNLIDSNGILTGRIYLGTEGANGLSAVTKSYVDTALATFSAGQLVGGSGALSAQFLPAFTGAASCASGAVTSFTLSVSGTGSAGTYTKFTTDGEGRMVDGEYLTSSDIPDVAYSVVSEKPATVAGYGITDSLALSGGTVPSNFLLAIQPSGGTHIATKAYADLHLAGMPDGFATGTIVSKSEVTDGSYPFFLRCNGGSASKTTYADLYSVIGDTYNTVISVGAGKPWKQQYGINLATSNDITGWQTTNTLPAGISNNQAVVTKGRIYLLGGHNGTSHVATVYSAPLNPDGSIGTWVVDTPLPAERSSSQAIVTKNRVYLIGGQSASGYSTVVYTASIDSDGFIGAWTTGPSLPVGLSASEAFVTKNRVYLVGGVSGTSTFRKLVYTATFDANGVISSWASAPAFPVDIGYGQAIVTRNRVYMLGGSSAYETYNTIYNATINSDGTIGTWTLAGTLPYRFGFAQTVVTENRVYLMAGREGWTYKNNVFSAPVNVDGTLGTWTDNTALPVTMSDSQVVVTAGKIYLLGGASAYLTRDTVFVANLDGGSNDYSQYYDIGDLTNITTDFRLPDISDTTLPDVNFYIKT